MKKTKKAIFLALLFTLVLILGSCSKTAENEHLPEYCQTYSGFASTASRDLYELLAEAGEPINRGNYLTVISLISLEFEVDDPYREIDLGGIQCFQNLTSLKLRGRSFKDLSEISALSNIQSIELIGTNVVSIDSFKNLSKIKSLVISETMNLQSVEGVEEMTKLTNLDLSNNGIVNIEGLNNLINLTTLYLNDNEIISFPSINQLEDLEYLDVSDNNIVELGEDLSGLVNLITFDAENNMICDISTLDDLHSLVTLNLSHNDLGCNGISPDFDSLENASNLVNLYLDYNNLTSIEGLRDRDISLKVLHINNNELTDITPISEYTEITTLRIHSNNIVNIDDLSGMTGLETIDLSNNSIIDFTDLLSIPNLESVTLNNNDITFIPDISDSWDDLSILDLHSNELNDTSGVEGHQTLETLILYNNGLTELTGISNLPELDSLIIFSEIDEVELDLIDQNPNNISIIRNSFNNLDSLDLSEELGVTLAGGSVRLFEVFTFGFELDDNVRIYNSISGLSNIEVIDFSEMDINIIDETSIQLEDLEYIIVEDNNLTDIRFILGNPSLQEIRLSGNNIDNLSVISGATTSDLDNLEIIDASYISADNDLLNAFIDLPSLTNIDLTGTSIISITNAFNGLGNIETINIDSNDIEIIVDSFNDIYDVYDVSNEFNFSEGNIELISNSFNRGNYHAITIENQTPFNGVTAILDSFNDITIEDSEGLVINNSDFKTIDGSFNGVIADVIEITDCEVEIMTDVFIGTTIEDTLALYNNYITTILSLNQITSVDTIDLNNNHLVTVSFLDGITGVTTLDISNQEIIATSTHTLVSIDGVNNMPLLVNFTYSNIEVTAIDGIKNVGITEFELSYTTNNEYITAISSTSFTGSLITYLDLDGHELDNISFLSNFSSIQNLYIGIDLADLSDFSGLAIEESLEILVIDSVQGINDFSHLSGYDTLESLVFDSLLTTALNNLDGLDSLETLSIDEENILTISNSFNDLGVYSPLENYLSNFTSLSLVTTSFDLYGLPGKADTININGDITVVDSFNNVVNVYLLDNSGNITPNFDIDSFDNMNSIEFDENDYDSYVFLNGYLSLNQITIELLNESITDLANDNISLLVVENTALSVNAFTLDLGINSSFSLTSSRNGLITIIGDMKNYSLETENADIILSSSVVSVELNGSMNDFTLNSAVITTVNLNQFTGENVVFNTDLLATITRTTTTELNATLFTVNTIQDNLDFSVRTSSLEIHDDFVSTYNLRVDVGEVVIYNTQPDLTIGLTGQDLTVNYDTLESLIITGSFDDLSTSSLLLDSITLGISAFDNLYVTSNQAALDITGSNIDNIEITNNSLTALSLNAPDALVLIASTNNQLLTIDTTVGDLTINGDSIPSIDIVGTSQINELILANTDSLSALTYGDAVIPVISFITTEISVSLSGNTASNITLSGAQFTTLDIDNSNATLTVSSLGAIVNADIIIDELDLSGAGLVILNLNALSDIAALSISDGTNFTTLNSAGSLIDDLDIITAQTSITVDAVNALNTTINGASITSVIVDVGANILNINASGTSALSLEAIAETLIFDSNTDILSIDNSSVVTALTVTSPNLTDILGGSADITTFNILDSATNLEVIGTTITSLNIDSNIAVLDVNTGLTTDLTVDSTSLIGLTATVSTTDILLTSSSDVTLTGSNLEVIDLDIGANTITLNVNKASLDLTLKGIAEEVNLNGIDVDSLTIDGTTVIDTLNLNDLNFGTLDLSSGTVYNIEIQTSLVAYTLTGNDLLGIAIDGDNLASLTINNSNPSGVIEVSSLQATLNLYGSINEVNIINDNLTALDLTNIITNELVVQANSLGSLNTLSSVTSELSITTTQNNFNLISDTPSVTFTSGTGNTMNLTSSLVGEMTLNTVINDIDITAASTDFSITAANMNSLSGTTADLIMVVGSATGIFTFDLTADSVNLNSNSIETVEFTGVNTIPQIEVNGLAMTSLSTNSVDVTSVVYNNEVASASLITGAPQIELGMLGSGFVTVSYTSADPLVMDLQTLSSANITLVSASSLNVSGDINDIVIIGAGLDSVVTDSLLVSNKLTMNNTLITDLEFIGTGLLNGVNDIEINTLSNTNIETILAKINGSTIVLISPIVLTDIYNYYYDQKHTELTDQEAIDSAIYNSFRTASIDDAWDLIIGNEFMAHLDETATRLEIDNQLYQSAEEYFDSYLIDQGIDEIAYEATNGLGSADDARTSIQVVLDDSLLTFTTGDIDTLVVDSIQEDSDAYATTQRDSITFTLS